LSFLNPAGAEIDGSQALGQPVVVLESHGTSGLNRAQRTHSTCQTSEDIPLK
jgi:hypothetical protein